ncbi:MAG: tyrosine-type recombinase/integrase [Muribaculaceae bacterium]|nr:tyrosine-type recombinase/integrase [Muribaculaceae bacterium]
MSDIINRFLTYYIHELGRSQLTSEAYQTDCAEFISFITNDKPELFTPQDIKTSDIRLWIAHLASDRNLLPTSIRRKIQALRAFFKFVRHSGIRNDNPAARIPLPKGSSHLPEFVKTAEIEDLLLQNSEYDPDSIELDTLSESDSIPMTDIRNLLIVELLYATGIRRAELHAISDSDINFSRGELRVMGKRSKPRIIPLHPNLLNKLSKWINLRNRLWENKDSDNPLFTSPRGMRISKSTINIIVGQALQPVSSGRKSPHTLRHTFATSMLNSGASINDVKEFLGHSSIATTQIYTHVNFSDISKAYKSAHPRAGKSNNTTHKK